MNEWIVAELYSISLFRCTRSSSSTHQLTENQSATTLIVDHLSNKVIMPEMDSLLIRIQLTISLVNNHYVCVIPLCSRYCPDTGRRLPGCVAVRCYGRCRLTSPDTGLSRVCFPHWQTTLKHTCTHTWKHLYTGRHKTIDSWMLKHMNTWIYITVNTK